MSTPPSNIRPSSGNRPEGNRPSGNRPEGNRPSGNRPEGNRPSGNRPEGNRPSGNRPEGNQSLSETAFMNLSGNKGSATSNILNTKLSGPNTIQPSSMGPNTISISETSLVGPNTITPPSTNKPKNINTGSSKPQSEESFIRNLFGGSNIKPPSSNTDSKPIENKPKNNNTKINNTKKNNTGAEEEPGFFENIFGGESNKPESAAAPPSTKPAENTGDSSERKNNTIINSTKSAVAQGLESLKATASGLAEKVTDRFEEVQEEAGSGDLLMTGLKIVIALLVIIAIFFVGRYLMGKYQDSIYSSPYLLEGSKNAKHALVVSQDPANPSYVPMPKSDGQDGIQFTYDFWLMIESFEYKAGEWKHVFHKGNASSYPNRAPGVWIHPSTNALRVYMNTQDNILEYVDIANIPIRKWIHFAIVLDDRNLDVYVNGYLKTRKLLSSVAKLNNSDFWCNMFGGFEGYLSRIRYYARAISPTEIAENVRSGPGNSECIDTGQVPPYLDDDWWLS